VTGERAPDRAEWCFRLLLRVYPRAAREELEEHLVELFHFQCERRLARGERLGVRFWSGVVRDTLASAWREWRDPLDEAGHRPRVRRRGGEGMKGWIDDFGYAARRLRRSPGFALMALLILVLGIGVNSTAFSLVNALLFQPPPFDQPERVVTVLQDSDAGVPTSTSYPAYLDMAERDVFSFVSAYTHAEVFLDQDGTLVPIPVEYASASYLDVIGLRPERGSWFRAEHDDPSGPPTAVVTHSMWVDRLGSDPDVLGRTLRINGGAATVIGVGPAEFNGGLGPASVDVWLSISAMAPTQYPVESLQFRHSHPMTVRARLAEGVDLAAATAAMDVLAGELARSYPDINRDRGITVLSSLDPLIPLFDAAVVPAATVGMGVVLLVLLVGTLNLANLLLVRSTARSRELAVRLALGAHRGRVVRTVLSEAVLLAAMGGVGGFAVAVAATGALRNARFDLLLPVSLDVRLDWAVVLFTAAMACGAGLLFGLLPALRATRGDVGAALREASSDGIGARRGLGATGALVAGQVAMSLLLLVVSGVFVEGLLRARAADPGFDWEHKAFLDLGPGALQMEEEAALRFLDQIDQRLEALPGVAAATSAVRLPAQWRGTTTLLLGSAVGGVDRPTEVPWNYVSLDYFEVMGIPLLHGRLPGPDDPTDTSLTVVSEAFGRAFWGRSDVVGETFASEAAPDQRREIIGVVGNAVLRALGEPPGPAVYWTLDFAPSRLSLIVETEGSTSDVIAGARAAIREIDDRIMILGTGSMREHFSATLREKRLAGGLLGSLGLLALLLAMLGIYGVVSFAVTRRRGEVGVRIALGAASRSVVALFVHDVAKVVVLGAVVGAVLALPAGHALGRIFTGEPVSPWTVLAVGVLLVGTSLVATVIPALRATATNPTDALRTE
jgi:putative ABC transport system permease protein